MSYKRKFVRIARMNELLVEALLLLIMAVPARAQQQLPTRHMREEVMNGEAPIMGVLPGTLHMNLAIMLPLHNEAQLDALLQELYDPESPSYGQYLTVAEFTDTFGPTQQEYDSVVAFAEANGMAVIDKSPNRMVVDVGASVTNIEKAFHLTLAGC